MPLRDANGDSRAVFFFLLGPNFAKFEPEKYDFNLYKGSFMEKKTLNSPDFEGKKTPNRHIFMISSSWQPRI
jgi:hypothetical protein